jgi:hypothetical protein
MFSFYRIVEDLDIVDEFIVNIEAMQAGAWSGMTPEQKKCRAGCGEAHRNYGIFLLHLISLNRGAK